MSSEPRTEQQVLARFQELRQQVATLASKIADLEGEAAEHDLVIKAMAPMEPARRCYRMIGDVLVERTVGEALPAVRRNRDHLGAALASLQAQRDSAATELSDFQARYKIRQQGASERQGGGGEGSSSSNSQATAGAGPSGSGAAQGVLV